MKLRVILLEPEYEGNIGSIARAMKNFGLNELWIVNPKTDIGDESIAFAMHAKDILNDAKIVKKIELALKGCSYVAGTTSISAKRPSNLLRITITPEAFAKSVLESQGKIGLVFGRESKGLSNEELSMCDLVVTIPANSRYKTLNIANASTIVFYELFKARKNKTQISRLESSPEDRNRLLKLFDHITTKTDMSESRKKLANRAFSNIISRSIASSREVTLMIGLFRKILYLINK
ncbi:RNA methyltransferase [[Eubacterium] cellulosolvens]